MEHNNDTLSCNINCQGITWWATLVVAVLAIPSFGVIIAAMSGTSGFMSVAVFIVACWISTYLGMLLMKNPKMSEKIELTKKP